MTSPWVALIPAALVLFAGSWLSYQKAFKATGWFPWCVVALYVANGWLWAWAARRAETDRQLYSVSVAWDVVTLAAYNVLPLIAVGVRLTPQAWAGLVMVVAGACLVKWGGE